MNVIKDGLYAKLTGDSGAGGVATLATGGIYHSLAPQGTTGRYLTYQYVSDVQEYTFRDIAYRYTRWMLKAYDLPGESWDVIGQIADRLEAILIRGSLTIAGYTSGDIRLTQRFDSQEVENGVIYPVVISDYIIEVSPA